MTDLRTLVVAFVAALQAEAEADVGPDTVINVTVNFMAPPPSHAKLLAFAARVQDALNETKNQVPEEPSPGRTN